MNDCVCTGPGYCARHKLVKTAHWVHLCQTNPKYFAAWERGGGPGRTPTGVSLQAAELPTKPGAMLRRMLGCVKFPQAKQMDTWGCDECEQRVDEIAAWIVELPGKQEAISLGAARRLVRMAIERARDAQRPGREDAPA